MKEIAHAAACTNDQVESTNHQQRDGRVLTLHRCRSCGAQYVSGEQAPSLVENSDAWAIAWTDDPSRIARCLSVTERLDPAKNPLHPYASSWPPGRAPTFPYTCTEQDPHLTIALGRAATNA